MCATPEEGGRGACRLRAAYHAGLAVNGFARSALASLTGRLRPLTAALRREARCAGNPARFDASKEFGHEHPYHIARSRSAIP
jgi:hypothetical protein